MGKYYIIDLKTKQADGPYDTYLEAHDNMDDETNEVVAKICPEENKLGAPNVYPFNTEEYNDGEEG